MVFYSEGRDYWSYLNGLIKCLIDDYNVHICYLSSSFDDPGIIYDKKNFNAYVIGDGHIRNWVFENLVADVMVMTTPDLHQYQLKRSVNKVHYIYVQHSLVSLHTIYRDGAFDYFDTIFCGGPHHNKEVRAAAHEDINLLTLLCGSNEPGLQALDNDGKWHDIIAKPNTISVNSGDMLNMCTGGFFPSTTHRVVNPDITNMKKNVSRFSIPVFLHPRDDVMLKKGYTAGQYLNDRLNEIGLKKTTKV